MKSVKELHKKLDQVKADVKKGKISEESGDLMEKDIKTVIGTIEVQLEYKRLKQKKLSLYIDFLERE